MELVIGTAGDWDCVVTVKSLPAPHHSVDFIFWSFKIIDSILELWRYLRVTDEALLAKTN